MLARWLYASFGRCLNRVLALVLRFTSLLAAMLCARPLLSVACELRASHLIQSSFGHSPFPPRNLWRTRRSGTSRSAPSLSNRMVLGGQTAAVIRPRDFVADANLACHPTRGFLAFWCGR